MIAVMQRRRIPDELLSKGIRLRSQRPSIDGMTVYRPIELLKRLRLIGELDLMHTEGEKHYYEVKTEGNHVHLACLGCGAFHELRSPLFDDFKEKIPRIPGFEIRVAQLEIGGFRRNCSSHHHREEETKIRLTVKH